MVYLRSQIKCLMLRYSPFSNLEIVLRYGAQAKRICRVFVVSNVVYSPDILKL